MAKNPSWKTYRNRWNRHAHELSQLAKAEKAAEQTAAPIIRAAVPLRQPRTAKAIKAKAERERIRAEQVARVRLALAKA